MVVHGAALPLFNQAMDTEVVCRLLLHTDAASRLVRLSFHRACPLHVDRCPWMSHKLWQLALSPQCLSLTLLPPVSPNPSELARLRARKWSLAVVLLEWSGLSSRSFYHSKQVCVWGGSPCGVMMPPRGTPGSPLSQAPSGPRVREERPRDGDS